MTRLKVGRLVPPGPETVTWPPDPWIWVPVGTPPRRVVVPGVPPSLNQILGLRPAPLSRIRRGWETVMALAVDRARATGIWDGRTWPPGTLFVRFAFPWRSRRTHDLDNLTPKWLIDGLRAQGVLADDSTRWVESLWLGTARAEAVPFTVLEWGNPRQRPPRMRREA